MSDLLSPGIQVTEIDASSIVPSVSNSTAVFAGNFVKGPVGTYLLISSEEQLVSYYGEPTNKNYNDFLQASSFLKYGNSLLLSRASNTNGNATQISGITVTADTATGTSTIEITGTTDSLSVQDKVVFGDDSGVIETSYEIISIVDNTSITLDRPLENDITVADDSNIYLWNQAMNSVIELVDTAALGEAVSNDYEYNDKMMVVENADDFEMKELSIAFTNSSDSKLKIISRNPGTWGNDIEICIATPDVFGTTNPSYAFDGIAVDDLFEYFPSSDEFGIVVKYKDEIVETYTVSLDETKRDSNNKSMYVENVINTQSSYIFIKENTANTDALKPYVFENNGVAGTVAVLVNGTDSDIQADDLSNAYELWSNKETVDVDIVIANELDNGASAVALVDARKDCIAFIGSNYSDTVGKKSAVAVNNLLDWRKTGAANINNMFVVACANYVYVYDRYNDVNRWINVAGHIAGLRSQTNQNRASWFASAGLERGNLKGILKISFSPSQAQRDLLYKNSLNPIVSFPGQGIVMFGQKTLLSKPSSFDRVSTRGLFNTIERALSKMARFQIMEFNDSYTRNRIISMIKPYLSSVKAGRGIQDFLVICDSTNNTPDIISRNKLVVDIFIKPTYVAEFIQLKFTNAGTNSFSEVIGG